MFVTWKCEIEATYGTFPSFLFFFFFFIVFLFSTVVIVGRDFCRMIKRGKRGCRTAASNPLTPVLMFDIVSIMNSSIPLHRYERI